MPGSVGNRQRWREGTLQSVSILTCQSSNDLLQFRKFLLECFHPRFFLFEFFIEALDGGERDPVGIDGGDAGLAFTALESRAEILSHWANMADRRGLTLIVPGLN